MVFQLNTCPFGSYASVLDRDSYFGRKACSGVVYNYNVLRLLNEAHTQT